MSPDTFDMQDTGGTASLEETLDQALDQEKMEDRKVTEARTALIRNWNRKIASAQKIWDDAMFKNIRRDRRFVKGHQWENTHVLLKDGPIPEDERRVINITQRHVKQQTAVLYGKNPKIVCRHKERMILTVWDGSQAAVQEALGTLAQAMAAGANQLGGMDPMMQQLLASQVGQAQSLLKEVEDYKEYKRRARGLARTLELVIDHCLQEQPAPFKLKMKDMVRRALICGLAFVKLTFNRATEPVPDKQRELERVQAQLAAIERLSKDAAEGELSLETDAGGEELRQRMLQLKSEVEVLVYEGLLLEYPDPTSLIVDPKVTNLRTFEGAGWIAETLFLTRAQIRDRYGVDLGAGARAYTLKEAYGGAGDLADADGFAAAVDASSHQTGASRGNASDDETSPSSSDSNSFHCLYEVYDKDTGVVFTICEGADDYVREPAAPDFALERFYPYHTLMFNDPDGPGDVVPLSDVTLLRPAQQDINSATEGALEHRIANRPGWVARKGALDPDSKNKLSTRKAHELVEVNLPGGDDTPLDKLIQRAPVSPFDPGMYETNTAFQNVLRVVGAQEADIGGLSGATATEAAIAQGAKSTASGSDVDALDECLSELVKSGGQLLLKNLSRDTVMKIVGESAVWPELTREEILREYFLEIEAGSTGKPNQAQETQRMQALAPLLFQVPNVSPEWIAKELIRRLDDRIDITEAIAAGTPSIQAMNAMAVGSGGASAPGAASQPRTPGGGQPQAQGAQGVNNAPSTQPSQVNAAPRPAAGAQNIGGFAQ